MSLQIRPLKKRDLKDLFDCGVSELNQYLQRIARQHIDKDIARTFVLIKEDNPQVILGFYTLVLAGINPMILPNKVNKKFPENNYIPVIKLARLGVSNEHKGCGYGKYLVLNAIKRVLRNYTDLGMYAIFVDPKSEGIIPFYEKFGFSLLSDGRTMYLPLRNLVKNLL